MPYNLQLKHFTANNAPHLLRSGAMPGAGGPMVNPRAPGFRTAMMFPGMRHPIAWQYANRGDPGLFGAIGKALGGVVKVAGKVAGGVARAAFNATPVGQAYNAVRGALTTSRIGAPASRTGVNNFNAQPPAPGFYQPPIPLDISGGAGGGGGAPVEVATAGSPGMSLASCGLPGHHLNRSGYWKNTSDMLPGASWQAPGTVCVKNRRLNPFNPRAASRAMRRLSALSKGMRGLEKQMSKMARGAGHRSSHRHSKTCGCKKR